MSSIQERLQLKREPLDKWSIREQLCLASAVARSGDQNWMSVSRALKPFGDPNRPADWFHQKNCAAQYGALLSTVDTPKRKKRTSGPENVAETPAENILRRLIAERQAELKMLLVEEKAEYRKLQEDMVLLQSGKVSEEQLDKWCKEIDDEERRGEQEAQAHAHWLKEREARKQEIERTWRPTKAQYQVAGQKRKISDVTENPSDGDIRDGANQQQSPTVQHQQIQQQFIIQQAQEPNKPALSPLLTSLLKSPSQVQNASSSILHTAITKPNQNPTIASLLNSSTGVTVSPGLQHLVSSAIGQEPVTSEDTVTPDLLDDAHLPNLKIDDLANSILVQDGPLPEIKKEEVDDIISEIIENAQDIVADPEQHLQLDGNGDINLELEDLEDEEEVPEIAESIPKEETELLESTELQAAAPILPPATAPVDPFEFQEDPVIFDSGVKPSAKQDSASYTPLYQQQSFKKIEEKKEAEKSVEDAPAEEKIEEQIEESAENNLPGSVEIVEVITEEIGSEKELNKAQIEDIVHSSKETNVEQMPEELTNDEAPPEVKEETKAEEEEEGAVVENVAEFQEETEEKVALIMDDKISLEVNVVENEPPKPEPEITTKEEPEEEEEEVSAPPIQEFNEDLYDSMNMEVKIDKTGKTKRDYSRTKKKEEKGFDMLLAIEKAQLEEGDVADEEKKHLKARLRPENDRSSSPWTEEEDVQVKGSKRRVSTPGTPVDSFPNSPASSGAFYEDDREHRNWKKSVMLVYNRLASNKYASLFLKPITEDQAPGYSSVVYRPMDLQTIKKNIDSGVIRTSLEFKRDVMLMFTNAIMYNKTNDTIYNMATQMQQESIHPIEILLQAQGEVNVPLRRETRTSESGTKRKRPTEENMKNKKRKED